MVDRRIRKRLSSSLMDPPETAGFGTSLREKMRSELTWKTVRVGLEQVYLLKTPLYRTGIILYREGEDEWGWESSNDCDTFDQCNLPAAKRRCEDIFLRRVN